MLSDEEREALQYFNTETKTEAMHYGAVLVKLIEKQSKEIEELKENNKLLQENYSSAHEDINWFCENYISKEVSEQKERKAYIKGTNDADELCNKKWEDKIKARIEELDEEIKVKREIAKNPMDRVSGRLLTDSIVELEKTKKVLQSLLEKE